MSTFWAFGGATAPLGINLVPSLNVTSQTNGLYRTSFLGYSSVVPPCFWFT